MVGGAIRAAHEIHVKVAAPLRSILFSPSTRLLDLPHLHHRLIERLHLSLRILSCLSVARPRQLR
jgi:hypothetical protein